MIAGTMGFALDGSAAVTLFSTIFVENSSSVALLARCCTMTWLRASGAIVATYWFVSVTVRIAQTEMMETGISNEARTMHTHALIRLGRCRRFLAGRSAVAGWSGVSGVSRAFVSLIEVGSPVPRSSQRRWPGQHAPAER